MDLGLPKLPAWMIGLAFTMMLVGAIAVVVLILYSIYWIISHLAWH